MEASDHTRIENRLRPLENRVLVNVDEGTTETDSGLYLPEGAGDAEGDGATGTVLSVGQEASDVGLGETVLFNENIGRPVPTEGGRELTLVRESNIMAVVQG